MSDEDLRQEMAKLRQARDDHARGKQAKPVSDKAKTAREARMAKLGKKEADNKSASPMAKEAKADLKTETTTMAEHTVASGDTLSHIAQKYYNSAARDKWMAIYEANKEMIGDNPSLIRIGQVLKIPKLSD